MTTNPTLHRRSLLQLSATASLLGAFPSLSLRAQDQAEVVTFSPPEDSRLGNLKDLDGYFPFRVPNSVEEWNARKEYVLRQIKVACGLWPMPERPAIEATVHGRVERDDYTVDRVYFESSPGLYVTGSLYLPKNATGRLPTVLCPHGHWPNGRFHDHGPDELKRQIESGGEKDEVGGRHPLQARAVQLARMGCMVFLYDMLGYADGGTMTQELVHGFGKQRPHLSSPDKWGLFSAQAELRCINGMGLQTWNSIRALDWITSRSDCDTQRIGVTGASGGGTQTFILAAIDDRVAAAFPAVMVSTAMQGGCTCENASYLRVNTGNIEFAALVAPRPIAMTGADDWTVEIETKGLPELKQHFAMLGVPDNVQAKYMKFPHNFNHPSRMMMYEFFNRTLNLGIETIEEREYSPLTKEEATVFIAEHTAPAKTEDTELAILRAWDQASNMQIAALTPKDAKGLAVYQQIIGGALGAMIGRELPAREEAEWVKEDENEIDGVMTFSGKLRSPALGEVTPVSYLLPEEWNRQVVLWIDLQGKKGIMANDEPIPAVKRLLKAGYAIASIDMYLTGDFTADGLPVEQMPVVKNPREFVGYTLGYNHPLLAQRVHDIFRLISTTKYHARMPEKLHLVGIGGAAPIVAAAAPFARVFVDSIALDTQGFRFASITQYRDPNLLPGVVKYGDLPALLALCSPAKLVLLNESAQTCPVTVAAYQAYGSSLQFVDTLDGLTNYLVKS
jgi:hypothetical protein